MFAEGVGDGWVVGEGFWAEGDWFVWKGLDGFTREGFEEFLIFGGIVMMVRVGEGFMPFLAGVLGEG